jgi:hypothetical protein
MKALHKAKRFLSLLVLVALLTAPIAAQKPVAQPSPQPPQANAGQETPAPREDLLSFDTLLSKDSYKFYVEVRQIGQFVHTPAVRELLAPLRLLGAAPKELTTIFDFLNAESEALSTSRVTFVTSPARALLPQALVVVELSSPEEAQKFEPKLRRLASKLMPASAQKASASKPDELKANDPKTNDTEATKALASPTPRVKATPQTKATPEAKPTPQAQASPIHNQQSKSDSQPQPTPLTKAQTATQTFFITRHSNLLFLSESSFSTKALQTEANQLLANDAGFRAARNRFVSEPLFLYYNINLAPPPVTPEPETTSVAVSMDTDEGRQAAAAVAADSTEPVIIEPSSTLPKTVPTFEGVIPEGERLENIVPPSEPMPEATDLNNPEAALVEQQRDIPPVNMVMSLIMGSLFGGSPKLPEAVGVAVAAEGDEFIIRALLIDAPGTETSLIPFFPQLISGAPQAFESQGLMPADTEIFISASINAPKIYDSIRSSLGNNGPENPDTTSNQNVSFDKMMTEFEQQIGFKLKEDLLTALGSEITIIAPLEWLTGPGRINNRARNSSPETEPTPKPGFATLISVKDKDALRTRLPRLLETLGIITPGASLPTGGLGDVEMIGQGAAAVAFIGDFLVIADGAPTLRWLIEAQESHQTLGSNTNFKNYTSWQPGKALGQLYVSKEAVETSLRAWNNPVLQFDDQIQEFMSRLDFKSGAVTLAAVDDDAGLFHELHLPKDWVVMLVTGMAADTKRSPMANSDMAALSVLMAVRNAQATYKAGKGKGSFGTREQLVNENLLSKPLLELEGYRIELDGSGDKYHATATPIEYGKTGRRSFYVDETEIIRGGDLGGRPANVSDKPLD